MWVNRQLFDMIVQDNKDQQSQILFLRESLVAAVSRRSEVAEQKAKDDITIDWLRNRVNALEKERTILWQRASGIALPTPEIEISKPRTVQQPNYDFMPSFEDPGDETAKSLGIEHDDAGELVYKK